MQGVIAKYFPGTPRPGQVEVLNKVEAEWDNYDVHVLQLPVAAGKTKIAHTIQKWAHARHKQKSHLAVPNNMLVSQLRQEFPRLCTLEKKESYRCTAFPDNVPQEDANCAVRHKAQGSHCATCPYIQTVRNTHGLPYSASNFHTALAHKIYKPVVIYDEAHKVLQLLQELEGATIWFHQLFVSQQASLRSVQNYTQLAKWLQDNPLVVGKNQALRTLLSDLTLGGTTYVVSREEKQYHGEYRECLTVVPIDTSGSKKAAQLWPKKVQKIVLMSATISQSDVEQLGLAGRRVRYYAGASPIPVERRPWKYWGDRIGSMSAKMQQQNLGRCLAVLEELTLHHMREHAKAKALVHATYGLAEKLGPLLRARLLGKAEVFLHTSANKMVQYTKWREHKGPAVFIASGFHEGIDLLGTDYVWQALCKIPYPSLEDPGNAWLLEQDPKRYAWTTVREVLQAYGRISRGPQDMGTTYFLDGSFKKLYDTNRELFPTWFQEGQLP